MKYLKWETAQNLVAAIRSPVTRGAAEFLLLTGARVSEALQVTVADVDWLNEVVYVPTLKRRRTVKREIPIWCEALRKVISAATRRAKRRTARLFPITRQAVNKALKKAAEEVGVPPELAHPHVLRHSLAMHLTLEGMPAPLLQKLLGHAQLTSTQVYTEHAAAKEIRQWLQRACHLTPRRMTSQRRIQRRKTYDMGR